MLEKKKRNKKYVAIKKMVSHKLLAFEFDIYNMLPYCF